jgi:hypothetical protein
MSLKDGADCSIDESKKCCGSEKCDCKPKNSENNEIKGIAVFIIILIILAVVIILWPR